MALSRITQFLRIATLAFAFLILGTTSSYAACLGGTPNGALDAGEQCDDNNLTNTDACTNSCQVFTTLSCSMVYGTEASPANPFAITQYDPVADISTFLPLNLSGVTAGAALSPDANIISYYDRLSLVFKSYNITTGVTITGTGFATDHQRMA